MWCRQPRLLHPNGWVDDSGPIVSKGTRSNRSKTIDHGARCRGERGSTGSFRALLQAGNDQKAKGSDTQLMRQKEQTPKCNYDSNMINKLRLWEIMQKRYFGRTQQLNRTCQIAEKEELIKGDTALA